MPFITTLEQFAIEKMMLQFIEDSLDARFGDAGSKLLPEIVALDDPDKFRAMHKIIATATSVEEIRRACAAAAVAPAPTKKKPRGKRR